MSVFVETFHFISYTPVFVFVSKLKLYAEPETSVTPDAPYIVISLVADSTGVVSNGTTTAFAIPSVVLVNPVPAQVANN